MTVYFHVGRRVPKSWFKRTAHAAAGFVSFQENLWLMIKQSLNLAKRKANEANTLSFTLTNEKESEDLNYNIEWIKIVIQGTEKQEQEEYEQCLNIYKPFGKIFKSDMKLEKNESMLRHFKSKLLSEEKITQAYKEGHGALADNSISQKMLEMGILTHIEWLKDFDTRDKIKSDIVDEPVEE